MFIVYQGTLAVRGYLAGEIWVRNVLDLSWNTAYDTDPELIENLQKEFNCQGFKDRSDRSLELPIEADEYLPPCSGVLVMSFGKRLRKLGLVILYIRLIQLAGVLLLSVLFKHLAAMDREDLYLDEEEKINSWTTDKKDSHYFSEKCEYASALVPLLSEETDDDDDDDGDDYEDDEEDGSNSL
ncbi:hypothetical protein BGZ76_003356 [Entomortierella beljakovae]|nr:hypothetical protein BGZ76_003356 [Entomortierella beljakovae]